MRRVGPAAAVALVAALSAGCGAGSETAGEPASTAAPSSPSASTATTATAEPAPPRPRRSAEPAPPASPSPTRDPLADLVEGVEGEPSAEPVDGPVLGADMSWPQCPPGLGIPEKRSTGQPLPVAEAEYVIVGLTNGPGFYPNPCLADQVAYVRERGALIAAYAVASYPEAARVARHGDDGPFDGSTREGALANTGYQQALFNVRSMQRTGFETPIVWIDVEPVASFEWSGDRAANAAVVSGAARAYRDAGYRIGVYSTPFLWEEIVGDLELGVPEWRAAGETSADAALEKCDDEWVIQGGDAVLGQWVQDARDMNLTCPGVTDLSRWFHRY